MTCPDISVICSSPVFPTQLDPIFQGDSKFIDLTFETEESDGITLPIDLTDSLLTLTIKNSRTAINPLYRATQTSSDMVNPTGGETQFEVPGAITAVWESPRTVFYDIVWTFPEGNAFTFMNGTFQVLIPNHTPVVPDVTFDGAQSIAVILTNNDLTAAGDSSLFIGDPIPLAVTATFPLEVNEVATPYSTTFTIDAFNELGDGFSVSVLDNDSFQLSLSSNGTFTDAQTGNTSAVIAPLVPTDTITITVNDTGNVFFGINGIFYQWDGQEGTTPEPGGEPDLDTNPTLSGFLVAGGGKYNILSSGDATSTTTWTITGNFDV